MAGKKFINQTELLANYLFPKKNGSLMQFLKYRTPVPAKISLPCLQLSVEEVDVSHRSSAHMDDLGQAKWY